MRVLISSVGTRGDVQPAMALAREVRALGHTVRVCVPPNFVEWATGLQFEAVPIGIEMRAPRAGAPPAPIPDLIADQFDTVMNAAADCDVIVGAGVHQYAVRSVGERNQVPSVVAAYAPVSIPSADLAPPGSAAQGQDASVNARLWGDTRRAWNERSLVRVNANRGRLGLDPIDDVLEHVLGDVCWLACDPTLGPPPATTRRHVIQTGAWLLTDSQPLDAALQAFLASGDPPVYVGLGSMPAPEGTARTLIDAVRAVGRRIILSRGWAEFSALEEGADCLVIGDTNQQALFPRVAAVVHHGGAGTTTTAALAGVPQVALPMFGDQFYWGQRLRALGVGAAVPFGGLSVDTVASALRAALGRDVAASARTMVTKVATDGARLAAQWLEEMGQRGRYSR